MSFLSSPDVVTGMLQVFSIDIDALLYLGATISFVTPLIARKFDIFPDRNDPIMLPTRVTYVELVELDMFDFDVILGMDWFHACFVSIDCRTRVVKFNFPNEPVLEWKGGNSIPRVRIISYMKACKMISKGCLYHIVKILSFS